MSQRFCSVSAGLFSIAVFAALLFFPPPAHSQITSGKGSNTEAKFDARFVPDDAFAAILIPPQELLRNRAFAIFPLELFQAQIKENFGIDPNSVSLIKVVLGLHEDGEPAFGVALEMSQPYEWDRLLESLQADAEPTIVGKYEAYVINIGPPGTVVHKIDEKTILFALPTYLEALLSAEKGTGKLPLLMSKTTRTSGINVLLAMDTIRPVVSEMAAQQARTMPPELLPLAELPELIDTAQLLVNFNNQSGELNLTLTGIDADSSEQIDDILNDSFVDGREILTSLIEQSTPSGNSDVMQAAAKAYAERLTKQVFDAVSVKRSGKHVTLAVDTEIGMAGGAILASFMSPLQQAIQSLTRQMDSLNNLRMVMLALHNYHAAYNRLPSPAIMSADGKPLLSRRVAILPFLEEQALYEQFRLDEPWDSEHNLPLSKRLPKIYATAGLRLPAGQTVIHAAVGEEIGIRPEGKTGFRDILDGTSNTIMILESTADSAVPWSKPADVEIDMDDPLANFIGSPRKSFAVGFADGAVKRLPDDIDVEKFKALLTRAGKEMVEH